MDKDLDLTSELDAAEAILEGRLTLALVREHASRYLRAAYGPDVVYRPPESFGNLVERWMCVVALDSPALAEQCIADIERFAAEQRGREADHG